MPEEQILLILGGVAFIQVVMVFAQLKLFEINTTLKDIHALLRAREDAGEELSETS